MDNKKNSANGNRVPATNPDGSQAVCPRCQVSPLYHDPQYPGKYLCFNCKRRFTFNNAVGNLADEARKSMARTMNRTLASRNELDGSDEFGYVIDWDSRRVKVAWHNYYEMEEMIGILYPGNPWGPGQYGSSSVGQDGGMNPERLIDIRYIIVPDIGADAREISSDAIKGLADTSEHAEAIIRWSEEHGQQMRMIKLPEQRILAGV